MLLLAAAPWACGSSSTSAKAAEPTAPAPTSSSAPAPSASVAQAPAPAGQAPAGASAEPAPAPPPPDFTDPKVTLVASGKDPKAELRYAPKVGQTSTLSMAMDLGMNMKMGEKAAPQIALPKMVIEMAIHVTSVAPDGKISYEFHGTNAKAIAAPGVKPEVLAKIQTEFAKLSRLKGSAVVDSRGYSRDLQMEIPPDLDPSMQQMMDSFRTSMRSISNPLPDEPVGIGAKWDAVQNIPIRGMVMKQITHSTLNTRNGSKYTLGVELEQSADPQILHLPNLPEGSQAKLVSVNGKGKGDLKGDLARVAPLASTIALESRTEIELSQGGQSLPLLTLMTMKMDMKSR
jgi:hypothetical protein